MAITPSSRRRSRALALILVLVVLPALPGAQSRPTADRDAIVHVLNRMTFGIRPGDVERAASMGLDAYVQRQLNPAGIDDGLLERKLGRFETLTKSTAQLADEYFEPALVLRRAQDARQAQRPAPTNDMAPNDVAMSPESQAGAPARQNLTPEELRVVAAQRTVLNELMQAKMLRAVESERQLQEVLTDFWLNHFNVFVGKGQVRQYLTSYERDVIRPHVLGSFRTLLGKVAHSPAMLFYLDNWQSSAPAGQAGLNPEAERRINDARLTPQQRQRLIQRLEQARAQMPRQQNRGLNENYARELMELHTLGVDAGYTQKDVVELARILTGWTIDQPRRGGSFVFRPAAHDAGTKTLLGQQFAANGEAEGERALDLLAVHPATAKHIAFKLAQRFVADEPPAALVERVAKVFTSTKGDLRAVTSAVLTSSEFRGTAHRRAKVKTPLEFVASAVRSTGATVTNAQPLVTAMQNLGMPLYGAQPPTGYAMTADAWVNTGSLLARMNFAVELVSTGRIAPQQAAGRAAGAAAAAQVGRGRGLAGRGQNLAARPVQVDVKTLVPTVDAAARESLIATLLQGQAADATRQTLARAGTAEQLVALTLGSPEFQKR
jgi:uncharacterized protein (DUF1800 family)